MPARSRTPWSGSARADRSMEDYLRGSGPSADAMREPAGPLVNADPHGFALPQVRRCVGRAAVGGLGANITVSADAFAALTTPLNLELVLSGRPLEVKVVCNCAAGASDALIIDVLLRGVSITNRGAGLIYVPNTSIETRKGEEWVMEPAPGPAGLEVVARREAATANGTIYADANNAIVLLAAEK